jgi:cellulose biosynthesis protein BcsQ
MSSIITFYSYKGGVGRSMALANIAYELSRRNKKVLMVDWDLEAPGLEKYFSGFTIESSGEGLLPLLVEYQKGNDPGYANYISKIKTNHEKPLDLLHSGREKDPVKYSTELEKFNWDLFFKEKNGGLYLENLRQQWLRDYEIVLIDSRTGLSDASGICTIFLPDVIIPMFTANYQSLFGIHDTMDMIQKARQKLLVDRMALTILPVPSRFGTRVEFKESQEWLDRIADILKNCFSDWLPKWIEPRHIFEQVKIPQVDYFSFGEKLAVVEQGTSDPEGMGYIYAKLADFLASDFSDIEKFVGIEYYQKKKSEYLASNAASGPITTNASPPDHDYLYDVYVSYPRVAHQWVRELLMPTLNEYLSDELNRPASIFFDFNETPLGQIWTSNLINTLNRSRTALVIIGGNEFQDKFSEKELHFLSSLEQERKEQFIFPVIYTEAVKPHLLLQASVFAKMKLYNFNNFNIEETSRSAKLRVQFSQEVEKLAKAIDAAITRSSLKKKGHRPIQREADTAILTELEGLAKEYDDIRKTLPSGDRRTRFMSDIVERIRTIGGGVTSMGINDFMKSRSAGKRLIAIIVLQEKPDLTHCLWLAEHIGYHEKPFIGYQASVAIYILARTFGKTFKNEISQAINTGFKNIEKGDYKDPNQISVLKEAQTELSLR